MNFGDQLKKLRQNKGMTLAELSDSSGVSISHLSRIESGERNAPKPAELRGIADALEIPYLVMMQDAGYIDLSGLSVSEEQIRIIVRENIQEINST